MRTADTELASNPPGPNPRRVTAGKGNRTRRQGLTPEGREKLRQAALRNQPWRHSSGPRTAEGKAKAAKNGTARQVGPVSVRQLRAELAGLRDLARRMSECRQHAAGVVDVDR
jgi:hypothetical protein